MVPRIFHGGRAAPAVAARTLVVGAGEAGRTLARDLLRSPGYGLAPIGFARARPGLQVACRPRLNRRPIPRTTGGSSPLPA